ncbi:Do family serine endopeptidase [Alloprevotella sp. oral taxon 473]|uniref:Do family serine endopeptidase n=1 Tax=Alloprevotella sp. oral taxon 473 TaxID=712469 RepID=UPI0002A46C77|nr:Do family serine endopeptidase [Alloprevotella sp. oral taxon 473]EKX89115.1 putative serine protease MucD [Alloprevotella sp. oral taxon 473 str. F0040]
MEKKIVLALFLSAFLAQGKASNVAGTAHPMTSAPSLASVTQPVDLTTAAEVATQSVVYIKVSSTSRQTQMQDIDPFSDFFGDFFGRGQRSPQQRQAPKRSGAGSGVILSADGYIVTNNHVVEDADEILVKLNDNREYKGRIIGLDKSTDLALLKIEAKDLKPVTVGSSESLKVGEWVLAIGNPYGFTSTVTAGIVSAKARSLQGNTTMESFIQTDAAINPGNSGGALVNVKGELVGINAMLYSQTGSYSGYGFAIPTTIMNKVVKDLREFGAVQRALIGVAGTDVSSYIDAQKEKGKEADLGVLNGFYIEEVSADGAAEEAGLKRGDVITEIDGAKVEKFGNLQEIMAAHRPGDKIRITYVRKKKTYTATLTLRNVQGTTSKIESVDTESMGAALRPLTDAEKSELGLKNGIIVSSIKAGKLQDAGLSKGIIITQVNDKVINSVSDFEEAVKVANMSTDRVLWIRAKTQSGLNRSYTVELGESQITTKKRK